MNVGGSKREISGLKNMKKPTRRTIRMDGYDYSRSGFYFVTICTNDRACIFGEVMEGEMYSNEIGEVVQEEWLQTEIIREEICLDSFVIMPNHLHGIIIIQNDERENRAITKDTNVGAHGGAPVTRFKKTLGSLIAGYKSGTTTRVNRMRGTPHRKVWQRNYYEHIIRNENDLYNSRKYIEENPVRWDLDKENPARILEN